MRNTKLAEDVVNEQAEVMARKCAGGYIDVMTGDQPDSTSVDADPKSVLVTVRFSDPAFNEAAAGTIIAKALIPGVAVAEGVPTWFRAYRADHATPVFDGSAGMEKANMILTVPKTVPGMTIGGTGLSHTVVKSVPGV